MKTKKWVTYTLTILFTLVILAAVGIAGFRVGLTQGAVIAGNMPFIGHMRGFDNGFSMHGYNNAGGQQNGANPHNFDMDGNNMGPGFGHQNNFGNQRGFDNQRGFNQRGGFGRGGGFFSPVFGLIKLVVLGALLWLGYKLVKNSGWKLVKANAGTAPAAVTSVPVETESVSAGDEKKE